MCFAETIFDQLIDSLQSQGYWVGDQLFDEQSLNALSHFADHIPELSFKSAGIGRAGSYQLASAQRSDRIYWLSGISSEEAWFLKAIDELRIALNRRLFLGLTEYECHFSRYAPGAFYKKHLDAFRQQSGFSTSQRKISTVLYLNQDWTEGDGGELMIYNEKNELLKSVSPLFGRFVIFFSEDFPHEVLPSTRERKSIAGWMRALSR